MNDMGLDLQISPDEIGGPLLICLDSAYHGGSQINTVNVLVCKKRLYFLLTGEVQFTVTARDDAVAGGLLQLPDQG